MEKATETSGMRRLEGVVALALITVSCSVAAVKTLRDVGYFRACFWALVLIHASLGFLRGWSEGTLRKTLSELYQSPPAKGPPLEAAAIVSSVIAMAVLAFDA